MKLTFLGTRGNIESKTKRHKMHSSLMVGYMGKNIMVDCGADWINTIGDKIKPDAIVITHAHPDHAWGLKKGAPCDVFATPESWDTIKNFNIQKRNTIKKRDAIKISNMIIKAFTVEHSTRAPAVGFKITAGNARIFYVPDLVYIHERDEALRNVQLYIGDGATVSRSMVRKRDDNLIGHTPMRTQLTWCQKEGVPKAVFTHCGSEIVNGDERKIGAAVRQMAKERGVNVQIAYDGLELESR